MGIQPYFKDLVTKKTLALDSKRRATSGSPFLFAVTFTYIELKFKKIFFSFYRVLPPLPVLPVAQTIIL